MKKTIQILLFLICVYCSSFSQELHTKVTINASRISTTVDKKIFVTLQTQLTNFLNSRKWTNDKFSDNEKIQCNFIINLENVAEQNVYKGTLLIQAARPVYNASYQTAIMNFQDQEIAFKYIEYQPIEFNENRVQGTDALAANLTATFAFYAYMILALDYDSFSPKGGEPLYQKAQSIVNNAPEGTYINGWHAFDGLRNRYWLVENLDNPRNDILHDVIYSYYRAGLDKMYDNEKEARDNILQALIQLRAFFSQHPNIMFVPFFLETKATELIGVFKKATADEKAKAVDLLSALDVLNANRYKQELK
jgi:hypothetical protein